MLRGAFLTLIADVQDLEEKSGVDLDGALEQVSVCEGVLAAEKQQHANTRQELAGVNQELEMAREDLVRERTKHREDVEVRCLVVDSTLDTVQQFCCPL